MTATALRPRSAVEIIDASFQLLRWHYLPLLLVYVIASLPALLLQLFIPDAATVQQFAIYMVVLSLNFVLGAAAAAAVAFMVSEAYLGQPVDIRTALAVVIRRLGSVFGAALIQGLILGAAAGIGVMVVAVAAIITLPLAFVLGVLVMLAWFRVAVWTFAMQAAVIIEGQPALASFDRSRNLASGHVLRIIGAFALAIGIWIAVSVAVGLLLMGIASLLGAAGERIMTVSSSLAMMVAYPLWGVVATLMYYDLRIRKEGFDLQILASQLEAVPAAVR